MNPVDAHIIADVGVIFGTIFDHRQPLRRETKSFVRAFDGKRGIQCKATQQADLKSLNWMKVKAVPECAMMANHLHSVVGQVEAVTLLCTELGKAEGDWAEKHAKSQKTRGPARDKRKAEIEMERVTAFQEIDQAATDEVQRFNDEGLAALAN